MIGFAMAKKVRGAKAADENVGRGMRASAAIPLMEIKTAPKPISGQHSHRSGDSK